MLKEQDSAGHRFDEALYRLAELIPYGYLLASTDPAGFIDRVADEIDRLRSLVEDAYREGCDPRCRYIQSRKRHKAWSESESNQELTRKEKKC